MFHYVVKDTQGKLVKSGSCQPEAVDYLRIEAGHEVIQTENPVSVEDYYLKNGEFKPYPEKTNANHIFDIASEQWVEDTSAESIALAKAEAIRKIESVIGQTRKQHITTIFGQDMLYTEKKVEAQEYLATDPATVQAGDFILLESEVGITAPDLHGVAQAVLNMSQYWKQLSGPMEALRISTSDEVGNATSISEVESILNQFESSWANLG